MILLRHGKSAYPHGVDDHDRPLAPRGVSQASLAGRWISENLPGIDRVVCSTATRTRQTLAATGLAAGESATVPVDFVGDIYEAYPEEIAEILGTLPSGDRTVLLVGHGPGIPALAEQLAGPGSDTEALESVRKKFPTSAIAVLAVDDDWPSLGNGRSRLVDFVVPRSKTERAKTEPAKTDGSSSERPNGNRSEPMSQHLSFGGATPEVDATAWVAPTARVIGRVTIGARTGVFYGAVVRGDTSSISIGAGTNLQDNVVVHADPDFPTVIGAGVSVGHAAVLHGCTVEDHCLIGMGAVVLNGAVIGTGSMVAAGAVVLEGTRVPDGSLVAGVPGKVRRELTAEERHGVLQNAIHYVDLAQAHREAHPG